MTLDAMLSAVLQGAAEPATPAARLAFADLCRRKSLYTESATLYAGAFAEEPGLAENLASGARYSAACAAALAGCGQGQDAAALDDAGRRRWRGQARDWLRADLSLWAKRIEGKADGRAGAAAALRHWQDDADLAGVRDADGLAKLPAEERGAWRKLWADVDALLKKATK